MAKIIQLPQSLIAKIAAGEVIERPVYAVKELIENALDAYATSIVIHIEQSGLRTITVIDDGEGMSAEDIAIAVKPHATSKLSDEDMLTQIATLGFRGEALSSIAAISDLTISSRRQMDAIGSQLHVVNGVVENVIPFGMPSGTHVTVKDLFSPVPARKKFLKSEKTEFRLIAELVMQYALSFSHVKFSLHHNGKQIVDIPKVNNIHERVYLLLGKDYFSSLMPIDHEESYTKISGFLARPPFTSSSATKQFIFVNGRIISDRVVSQTVRESLGTMLEKTHHPVFILFFTLPYDLIDVNVHPRKETIHFSNTLLITQAIKSALGKSLAKHTTLYDESIFDEDTYTYDKSGSTKTYAADMIRENVKPWDVRSQDKILTSDILQLHNLYLLTQTTQGFVLIDQHAAHERILYEQFSQEFTKQRKSSQAVLLANPLSFELSIGDGSLVEEHSDLFASLGLTFEHFGGNTYLLTTIPIIFQDRDPRRLINELLENIREEKNVSLDEMSQRMLAFLACRSAVMAGEKLSKKQMKDLIEKLEETPNNATCPHGRPTKIAVSLDRLNRMFKRK